MGVERSMCFFITKIGIFLGTPDGLGLDMHYGPWEYL